jgi:hypothetical protein
MQRRRRSRRESGSWRTWDHNPRRVAILLLGGDKTGNDRWYEEFVPAADRLYDAHLASLKREGLI